MVWTILFYLILIIHGKKPSDNAIEPKIISIPNKQIFKFGFSDTKKPQLIVSIPLRKVISANIFNISLSIYYSSSFINVYRHPDDLPFFFGTHQKSIWCTSFGHAATCSTAHNPVEHADLQDFDEGIILDLIEKVN